MIKRPAQLLWLTALLALISVAAHGTPLLNGLAVHQELGHDQFIGALYSEDLTDDASTLMAAKSAERMELKITAERGIPARRFNRMWIEGMAINNTSSTLNAQADNMVAFTKLFKERLKKNDHIVIALTQGQGVKVSVNGVALGTIADDSFFPVLLSTWLGRVPLSSTYRAKLLKGGDIDASLASRFNSISPSPERTAQIAQWGAPKAKADNTPNTQSDTQQVASHSSAPKAVASKPEPKADTTPKAQLASASSSSSSTPKPSRAKVQLPSLKNTAAAGAAAAAAVAQTAKTEEQHTKVKSKHSSSAASVAANNKPSRDEDDEDYVPTFTAKSLLASQRYFSNMVLRVQKKITYPRRALARGYEGSIRISVAIDRQGKLLSSKLTEESEHSSLNREALSAVKDAAPFPAIPAIISGTTHEFTIPINFVLAH